MNKIMHATTNTWLHTLPITVDNSTSTLSIHSQTLIKMFQLVNILIPQLINYNSWEHEFSKNSIKKGNCIITIYTYKKNYITNIRKKDLVKGVV